MKKTNIFRWIAAIFAATLIYVSNSAMAQIKVVGDDYSNNLTAKNYYDQDIDFEKYFPSISPIERCSQMVPNVFGDIHRSVNFSGDTIFICKDLDVSRPDFAIINGSVKEDNITIPSGYYIVSGFVFCQEGADSVRVAVGLKPINDDTRKKGTVKSLKANMLTNDHFNTWNLINGYLSYIVLTSLDKEAIYYYFCPAGKIFYGTNKMLFVNFYNQIRSFVGKKVVLIYQDSRYELKKIKGLIMDDLSDNLVEIKDEQFEIIDIVLKDYYFYIIIKGDITGSFALKPDGLYYAYSESRLLATDLHGDDKYDNSMDIPVVYYREVRGPNWKTRVVMIEENNWKTLKQRDKKAQEQQEKERKLQQQREQQEKAQKDAAFKQQMIAKHGSQFGELVANKQVAIGMTKDMCRDAWGRPLNTYRTTTRITTEEVWCYNYKTRIYFVNDKVVRIEN